MELKQVTCFLAVVEHGSFRQAAAAIPLAQPAVSTHVARLERELGVSLFERGRRGASLTAEGEALLPALRSLLAAVDGAHRLVADIRSGVVGRVRISAVNAAIATVVAPAIAHVRSSSGIAIELSESTPQRIEAAVARGDIDIGLTAHPDATAPSGRAEVLMSDTIGLCARKGSRMAAHATASLANLGDEQLILLEEGLLRRQAVGYFPTHMVDNAFVVAHHLTAIDLVSAGLGVALTPRVSVMRYKDLVWMPLADAHLVATLWMVRAVGSTPASDVMADALRNQVR